MHHACVVACALLIVTSMTLAARPSPEFLRPDVVVERGDDILAAFAADCVAREKTSVFGLKRGVIIQCTVTAVTAV